MRGLRAIALGVALAAAAPAVGQAPATAVASRHEDAAALAEARSIVVKLLPPGTYKKLMSTTMAPLMDNMSESIGALPLRQLAQIGGLDAAQAAALDKVDLARVMAIYDPHWQERTRLSMRAMFTEMGGFFDTMEPELREAYARAFVHAFTPAELADIKGYLSTPTGTKFAERYMTLAADPAIMDVTKSMMPKLMEAMPRFVEAAQKATSALPPARKIEELTPQQRAELAGALGVAQDKLRDPETSR